ncbi:hypothetical protein AVEN_185638-1 [Araneus ventricosus]|uniref:Reverse transcriptase domain-containing protein n=1 Tax=Araneus ventricosus TaxID=182803 RepID=A0A4Y2SAG4_ARAVE|nr:hypothetical protein AVEN_185638-1 [Araneus ventricosus]
MGSTTSYLKSFISVSIISFQPLQQLRAPKLLPGLLENRKYYLIPERRKDQRLASSYRPISLLPKIGKVLEKLMTQRLTYHLESANSLNERQHGFREDKSVDTAINELLIKIQTARKDGKYVLVLSNDIKAAFDNLQY